MFNINITPNKKDLADIGKMPKQFHDGMVRGVRRAMIFAEGKAKARFDTPGNLHARTGHYRRSIQGRVRTFGERIIGSLGANVVYAAIHETGGIINPKKGKYLKFVINGHWVSVKKVVIPARPLITPSITENIEMISNIIINDAIKEVGE